VWPIYKSITGHDPITGEDLEAWERAVGAGMAVVDLAALLAVIPSGGASVAGAAVARTVVRELLVNALATGVSLLTYDMAVALDLPPWLATLAAMGVGLGISVAGTRAVIRRLDAAGKPVGDPIEIDLAKPKTPQPEPPPPKGVDPDEPWPGGGLAADVIPGKPPAITDIPSVHPPDPPPPPKLLPEPDPAPITPDKPKTKPRPEPDPTPPKVPEEWVDVSHYNTHPADDFVRVVGVDSTGRLADVADSAADEAAAMAAVNPASNDLVLGPWVPGDPKSYEQVAHAAGATYFDMGQAYDQIYAIVERTVGEKAASEAMWKINQRFLDQQIAQGKTIYFTSDPRLIDDWRATYKEWTYIKARLGGKVELEQVGDYWVVVPL
jgi:outer membrane biosynthesis protein TonB